MSNVNAIRDDNHVPVALGVQSTDSTATYPFTINPITGRLLTDNAGGGSGTVTSVSVVSANGFAGTVATATTTPAITITTTINSPVLAGNGTALIAATTTGSTSTVVLQTSPTLITPVLGVATATSINGLTITSSTGTLTITNAKVFTVSNTLTLTANDGSTLAIGGGGTLGTNAYTSTAYAPIASPTFTGTVTIPTPFTLGAISVTSTGTQLNYLNAATGTTGTTSTNIVFSTSPTLTTPVLGVATATSITASTAGLSGSFTNSTDSASVQGFLIKGTRATPAANDEIYVSFNLNSSTGVTRETGRITSKATTVTNTSETANMKFSIISAGSLIGVMQAQAGGLTPTVDDGTALGTTSLNFSDLFLATGAVINYANGNVAITHTSGILTIGTGTLKITTPTNNTTSVVTVDGTQTITNKRNQARIISAASYTTDTGTSLDVSTCDIFVVTAQAGALLFNSPSGTPVQGEKLMIRIKDNGTARALTYNAIFRASSDLALPTTTVLSKTLYMGFIYNSTDTKWDLLSVLNNF